MFLQLYFRSSFPQAVIISLIVLNRLPVSPLHYSLSVVSLIIAELVLLLRVSALCKYVVTICNIIISYLFLFYQMGIVKYLYSNLYIHGNIEVTTYCIDYNEFPSWPFYM